MKYGKLIESMERLGALGDRDKQLLITLFQPRKIEKKTTLVNDQSSCTQLFFVNKGLLRVYHVTPKGTEVTRVMAWEGRFITNLSSFRNFTPNREIIECIEDSEVLSIAQADFEFLMKESRNVKCIYADLLEEYNAEQSRRYENLSCGDSTERLRYFKMNFPQLKNRISDAILACFLSVSRRTIERDKIKLNREKM